MTLRDAAEARASSSADLVAELDQRSDVALGRLAQRAAAPLESDTPALSVKELLVLALKNELDATELAAAWLPSTPEIDVKLALARQAGDEAKHFGLIRTRLDALGVDTRALPQLAADKPKSPLQTYLLGLTDTVSRVAAGQFTREALALVRNRAFIELCEAAGDEETAKLYTDVIQPDEQHHHELGRKLLLALATDEDSQARARAASAMVLSIAEDLNEILRIKLGARSAPGC